MTSTPSEELLSCPFCGGEPYVIEDDRYNRCHVGCDCVAGPRIWQDVGFLSDAIAAWNRRHTSSRRDWLPIESAPRDGTKILLCCATNANGKAIRGGAFGLFCQVAAWWGDESKDGDWIVYCSIPNEPALHFSPTHWQPLPPPPEET